MKEIGAATKRMKSFNVIYSSTAPLIPLLLPDFDIILLPKFGIKG